MDAGRRAEVSPSERDRLLAALVGALQSGDVATLEARLAEAVLVLSDGGGLVTDARGPAPGCTATRAGWC